MNHFKILPQEQQDSIPGNQTRKKGIFLYHEVDAYYHDDYIPRNSELREKEGTIEYIITKLKNDFKNDDPNTIIHLIKAQYYLIKILEEDLPLILNNSNLSVLTVCVVPRAKKLDSYSPNQLYFKQTVKLVVSNLRGKGYVNGVDYIKRHTDTITTHLNYSGYGGSGDLPYPGITKETCTISPFIKDKDILLIDDLYTEGVNVVEDAIQALFDNQAKSVIFYSVGKTKK